MVIKAYCVNVVVNIKQIYLNKHVISRVSLKFIGNLQPIAKKMFVESEIQKGSEW